METFEKTHNRRARLYTLENDWINATVTDFGGALVALQVADRANRKEHVLLGFDDAEAYATTRGSFGALLGRNANRISGGQIEIDGQIYRLEMNEPHATLHGGPIGFGRQFWSANMVEARRLVLSLTSPNGDQGFPGEVSISATYALEDHALCLSFDARTSQQNGSNRRSKLRLATPCRILA